MGTRDGGPTPDDLTQWRILVDIKIMNVIPVVADRVIHVLNKIAAECDIDDLSAPADRQQWKMIIECDAR